MLGFIGAFLGTWGAREFRLPEIFTLQIGAQIYQYGGSNQASVKGVLWRGRLDDRTLVSSTLENDPSGKPTLTIAKHYHVYTCGGRDELVYFGTTRPRISMFMQRFRNLGLIETNENHFLVIKEKKLTYYLAHIA